MHARAAILLIKVACLLNRYTNITNTVSDFSHTREIG